MPSPSSRCKSIQFDELTLTMICVKHGNHECQGHLSEKSNGAPCPDFEEA